MQHDNVPSFFLFFFFWFPKIFDDFSSIISTFSPFVAVVSFNSCISFFAAFRFRHFLDRFYLSSLFKYLMPNKQFRETRTKKFAFFLCQLTNQTPGLLIIFRSLSVSPLLTVCFNFFLNVVFLRLTFWFVTFQRKEKVRYYFVTTYGH